MTDAEIEFEKKMLEQGPAKQAVDRAERAAKRAAMQPKDDVDMSDGSDDKSFFEPKSQE